MFDLPSDFAPDLRNLRSRPDLGGSLWREPYLVEQTYGELTRVVRSQVTPPADVLDLGCGLGYLSLELARDGCRVLAIDADEESIALARKALDADDLVDDPDTLAYEVADLSGWEPPAGRRFDVILASRVLHHVLGLEGVLTAARRWLKPAGRLVAVDFAYDRFDRDCATWLHQMRGLLQAAGSPTSEDVLRGGIGAGIDRIWEGWWRYHEEEHELNTFAQLVDALRRGFTEVQLEWLPYLYWDVLEEHELSADAGPEVARFLRESEDHLIRVGRLPGLLFRWIGEPPATSTGSDRPAT